MMNKIIKKTVGKVNILSIVSAAVLVVAVVVFAIFGLNRSAISDDVKTLTVKVNQYAYTEYCDEIEDVCNDVFDELNLSYEYDMKGEMSGDESEIVYVFNAETELASAVEKLNEKFATETAGEGSLAGAFIRVTANSEYSLNKLPEDAFVRTVLAIAVFVILAGLYLTIRQNLVSGITVVGATAIGAILTGCLVIITRLPLSSSVLYVFAYNALFVTVATVFSLNKFNAKKKENSDVDAETLVSENVAVNEVVGFSVANAVAFVLVGVIATTAVRYFAITAFVSLIAGTFSALIFAPALYLPLRKYFDKKAAQRARYDYKKGVTENKN